MKIEFNPLNKDERRKAAQIIELFDSISSRNGLKERQLKGIAKARERGVQIGRKPKMANQDIEEMRRERDSGVKISELMKKYSISKASVYRLLSNHREGPK
jgi:DNA invertase Pin-like site-specific DNA recombinase